MIKWDDNLLIQLKIHGKTITQTLYKVRIPLIIMSKVTVMP